MPTHPTILGKSDAGSAVSPPSDVVEAEIITDHEPSTKELILRGRAAFAGTEHNPEDWADQETEDMLAEAIPQNTLNLMFWALGGALWYQAKTGCEIWPMTPAMCRQWIKDHWSMKRADGRLRGRRGRPYSPRTVETRVYLMSKIWQLKGYVSPVGHPKVQLQLRAYAKRYERAGHSADVAHAFSHDESVAIARHCLRVNTVSALRNAAAFRLQFDTGARASEILGLRIEDVAWELPAEAGPGYTGPLNAVLHIRKSKTDQDATGRYVGVEAVPDVDGDVDPAALLGRYVKLLAVRGHTQGPLWLEVTVGAVKDWPFDQPPKGRIVPKVWSYDAYEAAFCRAVKAAGLHVDPLTGAARQVTSHGNRAGHISEALDGGVPVEQVARRTGHAPTGSIHNYYRLRRRFGQTNTGTRIRTSRRRVGV